MWTVPNYPESVRLDPLDLDLVGFGLGCIGESGPFDGFFVGLTECERAKPIYDFLPFMYAELRIKYYSIKFD